MGHPFRHISEGRGIDGDYTGVGDLPEQPTTFPKRFPIDFLRAASQGSPMIYGKVSGNTANEVIAAAMLNSCSAVILKLEELFTISFPWNEIMEYQETWCSVN